MNHSLPATALVPVLQELAQLHGLPALAALASAAANGGAVKLRSSVLAEQTGCSERTVTRHLAELARRCPSFSYEPGSGRRTTRVMLGAWRKLRRPADHRKRKTEEPRPFRPAKPRTRVDTPGGSWGDRRVGGVVLGVSSENPVGQIQGVQGARPVDKPIPTDAGPQREGDSRPRQKGSQARKVWKRGRFGQAHRTRLREIPRKAIHESDQAEAERQARRIADELCADGWHLHRGGKKESWAPVIWTLAARLGGWDAALRHLRAGLGSVGDRFAGWSGWAEKLGRDPRMALRISFIRATAPSDCGGSWRVPTGSRAEDGPAWTPATPALAAQWEKWQLGEGPEPSPGESVINRWTSDGPVWRIKPPTVRTRISKELWADPGVKAEARRRGEKRVE